MLKIIKGRQIKSVAQAEQKIQKLLGTNEANWKDVAKIAIEVKEQELYKDKYKSFTAWVNAIAKKCYCKKMRSTTQSNLAVYQGW